MKTREPRRSVVIHARMRSDTLWVDVCIRNISSRGLLVQAAGPPPRGTYVEIFRARHVIVGRVVWTKGRRFGIHTQDRLDIGAIIEEPALPKATRGMATPGGRSADRRPDSRRSSAAEVAQRLERSRRMSATLQFGAIISCGVVAAVVMASVVQDTLSRPLESIARHLER